MIGIIAPQDALLFLRDPLAGKGSSRKAGTIVDRGRAVSPPARASGPVWSQRHCPLTDALREMAQQAGVPWQETLLSNSYVSYRLALVQDAAQVALEIRRSPHTVLANFTRVATTPAAERWFSMLPREGRSAVV